MEWVQTLSGMFVAAATSCGVPPAEHESLRELFAADAARHTAEAVIRAECARERRREQRIAAHARAVAKHYNWKGGKRPNRRGAPRAVVACELKAGRMVPLKDARGQDRVYPTVSAAAASVERQADAVCSAIRRGGQCGGVHFRYLSELDANNVRAAAAPAVSVSPAKGRVAAGAA